LIEVKIAGAPARYSFSMSLSHLLAEAKAPRYTSYPTAPHFSAAVMAETCADWLAALPRDAPLSVYLHVPFCRELCSYCGCHTKAVRRPEPVARYARTLQHEIALVGRIAGSKHVARVHWGGGTPSILGAADLIAVHATMVHAFDLGALREHAIELDPRAVDAPLVDALRTIGVDRASLGVQDLNPHVQRAIGRIQPLELVQRAVELLRAAGIARLSFDLMYGLPEQSLADLQRTVELAARMRPDRIAVFGYAHVPWFKPHQRLIDAAALPGAAARLQQAEATRAQLIGLGYLPIGLDHFALPGDELAIAAQTGRLHRNFQGYTVDDAVALLGFGASAIGRMPQGYMQNARDLYGYQRAIDAGRLAAVKGFVLSEDDRVRAAAIERLMCDFAADLAAIGGQHAAVLRDEFAERIAFLLGADVDRMVRIEGHRVAVTEAGRPFVRLIASALDRYLPGARHSQAV
jgi:oxygen-independent coproporphyrinogen-3 oxidase